MEKMLRAMIVQSSTYVMGVSIRDTKYEDIRPALREAGFRPSERVVIIEESTYEDLQQCCIAKHK